MKRLLIGLTVKLWLYLSRLVPSECVVLVHNSYMDGNGTEHDVSRVAGVEIVWIDDSDEGDIPNEGRMERFNIMKRTDFVNQFAPECKEWAEENFLPKL